VQRLAAEVGQDRAALEDIMGALGIPVRAYKVYAAWIGEKAARLKLNGYLLTRSPLSGLEELENAAAGRGRQGRGVAHPVGSGGAGQAARPRSAG
jgi:hypothetical protein